MILIVIFIPILSDSSSRYSRLIVAAAAAAAATIVFNQYGYCIVVLLIDTLHYDYVSTQSNTTRHNIGNTK